MAPIAVNVVGGVLSSVAFDGADGTKVAGTVSKDGRGWHLAEPLAYGKSYELSAVGTNAAGKKTTIHAEYTTLTPPNKTMPHLQYGSGYGALTNGATYGVGIVPRVHWDESIEDKKNAESLVKISTSPHVDGAWYWSDNKSMDWRPKNYWPAGTVVKIEVVDYGKQVSPGLYGQADVRMSFKIGDKRVTIADDNAPEAVNKVNVYFNDKLVRTMKTSMGKHSGVDYKGKHFDFHTMQGTYTVLDHEREAMMSSESYGLPAEAPGGYKPAKYPWATRISTDGIFLHEKNNTWAQDNGEDVSHGCLNLRTADATWFFNNSRIGDVVVVRHTDGPTIQYWQNGAWSIPWSKWLEGGARA